MYLSILVSIFTAFLSGHQSSLFLWPVTLGTTRIPCPPFRVALLFQKTFEYVAWYKVAVRRRFRCHSWWRHLWIAEMDNLHRARKYGMDQGGFLQIRNVTRDDDGMLYRCVMDIRGKHMTQPILLAVVPEEGKIIKEFAY